MSVCLAIWLVRTITLGRCEQFLLPPFFMLVDRLCPTIPVGYCPTLYRYLTTKSVGSIMISMELPISSVILDFEVMWDMPFWYFPNKVTHFAKIQMVYTCQN